MIRSISAALLVLASQASVGACTRVSPGYNGEMPESAEWQRRLNLDHHLALHAYYRAFRERDRATLERLLTPDLRHISSFAQFDGRDRMLDTIWPSVGQHWAENVRIYGDGPEYMVRYRHSTGTDMAEYVRFDRARIAEIHVFIGRAPTSTAQGE